MRVLVLALALAAQPLAASAAAAETPLADIPYPAGAPRDDYLLVAWCYGTLRGYLELYDQAMPEVKRIEAAWRRPGSNLAEDMKVYADMREEGQRNLKLFTRAMTAAEKASMRPINALGAEAVKNGRKTWAAAPNVSQARLAQEWMSWSLPARCIPAAEALEKRALLAGSAFVVNADPANVEPEAPAPDPTAKPAAPQSVDEALDKAMGAPVAAAPAPTPAAP